LQIEEIWQWWWWSQELLLNIQLGVTKIFIGARGQSILKP
jgi:hypothetical protein